LGRKDCDIKLKRGDKFIYQNKHWEVIGTGAGMIYAECISKKLIPAVQIFKIVDGEIVRC